MQEINKLREELASLRRYCEKSSKQAHDYRILTMKQLEEMKITNQIFKETLEDIRDWNVPKDWKENEKEYIQARAKTAILVDHFTNSEDQLSDMTHPYYKKWQHT